MGLNKYYYIYQIISPNIIESNKNKPSVFINEKGESYIKDENGEIKIIQEDEL